ncbi:DUF4185 domain-containing protein [Gordonia malaquae]|uniref:DUF4185 domain-containing protein n=1 Tax=Gordonia malaquae TaxID=410332 RepID=UPI0030FEA29E
MRPRRLAAGVAAACCVATVSFAFPGAASAAPCGNPNAGNGSSLPFLPTGSLGSGSGDAPGPTAEGPQSALPKYNDGTSAVLSWVTGPRSPNSTFARFGISGTDLGIAWDNGAGQTLMAFGDTFGNCTVSGKQWRHNVLLRTDDTDLSDGLTIADGVPGDTTSGASVSATAPRYARQMIGAIGWPGVEVTTIPTAAIAIEGKQYVNYMSVRKWGAAGMWDTNFSAIAVSADNGQTWTTEPSTIRVNAPIAVPLPTGWPSVRPNDAKFQQSAYVAGHGADAGWVFQYGTPNGRFGAAYVARFRPSDILDLSAYEYWTGSGWSPNIDSVRRVVGAPVTEVSVAWSEYLGKYVMVDSPLNVHLRTADRPQGPWSLPRFLFPSLISVYAPMMLPSSPALRGTGPELYMNASRWDDYNVLLLRSRLRR